MPSAIAFDPAPLPSAAPSGSSAAPARSLVIACPSAAPRRRLPDEENPVVPCACGICGLSLHRFDLFGRPRRYLPGHNRPGQGRPKASRLAVLAALHDLGPSQAAAIATRARLSEASVRWQLSALRAAGLAAPTTRGVWALSPARESGSDPSGHVESARDPGSSLETMSSKMRR